MALLTVLLAAVAVTLYYRIDEAPTAEATRWSAPPPREVADTQNAWLHLLGVGAPEGTDPVIAGRQRVDAYLAHAASGVRTPLEEKEAVPPVEAHRERDGFDTVCRAALGGCIAWAATQRTALRRLIDANALRLSRVDRATGLPQWQEPPLRSTDFPMFRVTTIRLHTASLALRAADGDDAVALGQGIADHAALWRRASEQSDWLVDKMVAVTFLADYQRLLVEVYTGATTTGRAALDAAVDAALAPPSDAARRLDLIRHDMLQIATATARAEFPGVVATLRRCANDRPIVDLQSPPDDSGDGTAPAPEPSCSRRLLDNATFLPQATTNRLARHALAYAALLDTAPADEAAAEQRYAERRRALLDEEALAGWLPVRNSGGIRFLRAGENALPDLHYRRRLNDHELLRRMLVIRIAALRAAVADDDMAAFLAEQPAALQHPYPDKAIAWDAVRAMLIAPTAVDGTFDEAGIELRVHDVAATQASDAPQ